MLKAAGVPHVGTHGIRHRSTTDIANSGVPTKVGMKLTGHKTVAMFMHYVHTEDKPVRDAAELVASRRQAITGARQLARRRHEHAPVIRSIVTAPSALLGDIRALIEAARKRAASTVNSELTMLYWRIGQRIPRRSWTGAGALMARKSCPPWRRSW